jgi:hypothetical protein
VRTLLSLAALLLAPAAMAQDISGAWQFRTQPRSGECVLAGEIAFKRTAKPSTYSCTFVVRTDCAYIGGAQWQKVEQTCSVAPKGKDFEITGRMGKVVDAGPASQRERLVAPGGYVADNFTVRPNDKGELVGFVHDSIRQGPVKFWRKKDNVS